MKFLALIGFFFLALQAQAIEICQEFSSPFPGEKGEACAYPGSANGDILYFLHGRGGSAHDWINSANWTQQVRDYWQDHGHAAPTVVSVSLGRLWLLAPKTSKTPGSLLDLFARQLIPSIEAKLGGLKGRRLLLGISMGGFNSLQLGMKTDLFQKVASICAPVADGITPFSSDVEVDTYIKHSTAFNARPDLYTDIRNNMLFMRMAVSQLWTEEEFRESDALVIARNARSPRSSAFYLTAGYYDQYLAYEGNAALANALQAAGTSAEWHPQWGGHCVMDIPSLSEFLVK